ncbi:MAG: hypothetical protein LQ343_003560 [Gyalolechia ehrenbergii]|nr:MAG: hypothetical protein LQ343_003560 [Gyalolechia ehrenbergii]
MSAHHPDATRMLDTRGYSGPTIHSTNPLHLLEKPVRDRITESYYWKEQCFALNAATICDKASQLTYIGGTYGQQKPTPFLCLLFKLLQLLPEKEIVLLYLRQKEFKYLTALAAFYVRLTFEGKEVYRVLEPLLGDFRRLRRRTREGGWRLSWVDAFVDDLLVKDRVCATGLRKLPSRMVLEDLGQLEVRVSPLGEEIDEIDQEEEEEEQGDGRSRDSDEDEVEEVDGNGYVYDGERSDRPD